MTTGVETAGVTDRDEMEGAFEAVLFAAAEPVPRSRLLEIFDDEDRERAERALAAVLDRYRNGAGRGVMVEEVAGGVRLATRPEFGDYLRRFFDVSSTTRLSMAALETLAIVAYRQPITAPEIQELRGVDPASVLKTLLERRLVRIAGRLDVVGRPFVYRTTRDFLAHFGLDSIDDLPPLEEFAELLEVEGADLAAFVERDLTDREEEILRLNAELDEADDGA